MMASGRSLSLLLLLMGTLPSCANATHRGRSLYTDGRLVEAAEVFEHGESRLASISAKERVSYGLYRGATLLSLGDLDGAARWLYFAQQAANHSPGSLEASDEHTLRLAFKDLDRRRALVKSNVDPLTGAMARVSADAESAIPDVVVQVDAPTSGTPLSSSPLAAPLAPNPRR